MTTELASLSAPSALSCPANLPCPRWSAPGGAGRFAWDEFFYAEHHNPHTQKAYMGAVKRFLAWAEGQGVELRRSRPGRLGQYLVGLGGSPASATCTCRRYPILRPAGAPACRAPRIPAASVKGVQGTGGRGQDAGDQASSRPRMLLASIPLSGPVKTKQGGNRRGGRLLVGLRDRAILATALAYTACRAGAVAKLRLGDLRAQQRTVRAAVPGKRG